MFLAREPLTTRKLAQLASLADGTEARTLVRLLNEVYDREERAFRVEEVAGGVRLLTRPCYAAWVRRLQQAPAETRLSGPALETLSVVAYRQPVLRAQIEAVRGVQCGEMLRQLMERDLVRIVGRADELGRPFLYGTTRRFLEVFGLRHLDELPRSDLLRAMPAGVSQSATTEQANAAGAAASTDRNLPDHSCVEEPIVRVSGPPEIFATDLSEHAWPPIVAEQALQPRAADDEDGDDEYDEEEDEENEEDEEYDEEYDEEEYEEEGEEEEYDDEEEEEEEEEWEEVGDEEETSAAEEDEEDDDWDDEEEDYDDDEEDEDEEEEDEEDWEDE